MCKGHGQFDWIPCNITNHYCKVHSITVTGFEILTHYLFAKQDDGEYEYLVA